MKFVNLFLVIFIVMFTFGNVTAESKPLSAYSIGVALGKVSQNSFKQMKGELVKKDFLSGFKDLMLNKKPDIDSISDEDSYEVGMFIAAEYSSKLKKIIKLNNDATKEFIEGFNAGLAIKNTKLTVEDKQILKNFKQSEDEDN